MTVKEKYLALAEKLGPVIAIKRRSREENTPKRALQAKSARIEADHLERVRDACLVLAKSEGESWIGALKPVYTKADLLRMTKTRVEYPSYYSLVDTGVFYDTSDEAVHLRSLMDAAKDPVEAAEKARQNRIAELIEKVKFQSIPGFFPTPPDVVKRMIEAAELPDEPCCVLEPSAGIGSIADEIPKRHKLTCIEINPVLCDILTLKGYEVHAHDFPRLILTNERFDRIIMNPPFENGKDAEHIWHAYSLFLAESGRLVAIVSEGPFFRGDKKSVRFREWLESLGEKVWSIPLDDAFDKPDAFRKTGVKCRMLVIDK